MSNRFHNKYHRHNHHTDPTTGPLYPDSAYDPIASRQSPFKGEFYAADQITTNDSLSARQNVYATNAQISGNVVVDNNLTIHGESQFDGAVNIDDTFTVNGPSTLNGTLNVNGNTTLNGTLVTNLDALFNSNVEVIGNLTVQSNLNVLGTTTTLDTEVIVTSAMEITNNNTGPALQVIQTGEYPVAHFLDEGNTSLIIQGTGGAPGFVGINTATPNQRLTVVGNVSAKGDGYFEDLFISGNQEILGSLKVWEGIVVDANSSDNIALSANGDIHISNDNVLQFGYFPAVNDGGQIFFQSDSADYGRLIIQTIDNADSAIVLRQYDQGLPIVNYNRLVVGSDGNVGIGTGTLTAIETFPARLTVYGTLSTSDNITTFADLAVNGGDITTTAATFNLINSNATALNIGGAATSLNIGSTSGNTNINNNLMLKSALSADGNFISTGTAYVSGSLNVKGDIVSTGTTYVSGNLSVKGDVEVAGGDVTTASTGTASLFNTNASTVNIGGAATSVQIGSTTGATRVNNQITAVKGLSSGENIDIFYNKKLVLGYSSPLSNDGAEIGMIFPVTGDDGELIIGTRDNGNEPIVFRQSKNDALPSWDLEPVIIGTDHHIGIAAPSGTRTFPAELTVYGSISTTGGSSDVWNSLGYGLLTTSVSSVVVGGLSAVQFLNPISLNPSRTYELTVFVDLSGASLNANSVLLLSANNNFSGGGRINYFNTSDKTLLNSGVYTSNYNVLSAAGTSTTAAGAKSFTYDVVITTSSSATTLIAAVSSSTATNTVRGFSPGTYWKAKALS